MQAIQTQITSLSILGYRQNTRPYSMCTISAIHTNKSLINYSCREAYNNLLNHISTPSHAIPTTPQAATVCYNASLFLSCSPIYARTLVFPLLISLLSWAVALLVLPHMGSCFTLTSSHVSYLGPWLISQSAFNRYLSLTDYPLGLSFLSCSHLVCAHITNVYKLWWRLL